MIYPLKNNIYITQHFGENPNIYKQFGMKGHNGTDFRASNGTPVYSTISGVVTVSKEVKGYGLSVRVKSDTLETIYGHLKSVSVVTGNCVEEGKLIGLSDNTGFSTGPHLHFGIRRITATGGVLNYNNGYFGWIDPEPFFNNNQEDINFMYEKGVLVEALKATTLRQVPTPNGEPVKPQNGLGSTMDKGWFGDVLDYTKDTDNGVMRPHWYLLDLAGKQAGWVDAHDLKAVPKTSPSNCDKQVSEAKKKEDDRIKAMLNEMMKLI